MTAIWAGCHLQLARLLDTPEIAMSEAEAKQFLVAWQQYLRHLSITATQKTVDLMTALGVTVFLYTPRLVAVRNRKGKKRQPDQPQAAQVFAFRPAPSPQDADIIPDRDVH